MAHPGTGRIVLAVLAVVAVVAITAIVARMDDSREPRQVAGPIAVSDDAAYAEQLARDATVYPGQVGVAVREFAPSGSRRSDLDSVLVLVRLFETAELASAALDEATRTILDDDGEGAARSVDAPIFGNESVAFAWTRGSIRYGQLYVRDGTVTYSMIRETGDDDPVDDLVGIAEGIFATDRPLPSNAAPASLLALVPGPADLPPGFVVLSEAAGTPAPNATPAA